MNNRSETATRFQKGGREVGGGRREGILLLEGIKNLVSMELSVFASAAEKIYAFIHSLIYVKILIDDGSNDSN
jgi:hypothetical protein